MNVENTIHRMTNKPVATTANRSLRVAVALLAIASICELGVVHAEESNPSAPAKIEFFEKRIRPLLVDNCINCHSDENGGRGQLRVDDRNGIIEGGSRGAAVVPGHPEQSLLIKAVRQQGNLKMPPQKQLSEEQIADLEQWIRDGVAWPPIAVPDDLTKPKPEYDELRKSHWAWQPMQPVTPPTTANESFVFNDIDRFVLAKLAQSGLTTVADADKRSLIRRVTFDLTGLPPTPEEITQFEADSSPDSFEKVVDRLLKSPAYGERWARHWLDVARFGESTGSARNIPYPHAWRYRDYVVDSFTSDKPYDQFIREQVAGDLLPANSPMEKADQLIATGFLAIGVKDVNQRFKVRFMMDNIDEQIDTVSRSVLGLTVSCARCHDHKFDPIPTVDYYALAGIFQSTDLCAGVRSKMGGGGLDYYDSAMLLKVGMESKPSADTAQKAEELTKAVEAARAEFEAIRGKPEGQALAPNGRPKQQVARQKLNRLQQELAALSDPAIMGKVAYGLRDSKKIADTQVRIRGEAEKIGPTVPRSVLSLIDIPDQPKIGPYQSGRLELAHWLTSDKNVLTQRVIVNRVWQHLFSQGLVTTVDNFGLNGDKPSHPELLDYLSQQFVKSGWSIKKLIRTIVLSHTYRLSSDSTPQNFSIDPANRLVWRHTPRRLDAEEIRDATLAASGKLNATHPEGSSVKSYKVIEMRNNGREARDLEQQAGQSVHRSLYLPLVRGVTPKSLEVFNFAEQGMVTGQREITTVPTQALYLLNDPFVRRHALALAERVNQTSSTDDRERLNQAFQLTLGRGPNQTESDRAIAYLSEFEAETRQIFAIAEAKAAAEKALELERAVASAVTPENTVAAAGTTNTAQAQVDQTQNNVAQAVVANPDDIDPTDVPLKEEVIEARDPKLAAWASLCQVLLGTAEFRYLK